MDLAEFITGLRPEGTFDAWVALLAERGRTISRAALEHYVRGRRRPEPEIFADLLLAGGREADDAAGWAAYARATGLPDSVIAQPSGTAA